jgi:hypothetical protein
VPDQGGQHQAVGMETAAEPQYIDQGGCTPEVFSKWYYRILRFGSLGISLALVLCSITGFSSMFTDYLGLGARGLFFQFVFALIGFIWGILLFMAEFAFLKFRRYFGFLRKRIGRAIVHSMLGTLCILFGYQSTSVVLVMVVGCIMVFFGLMHFGALFPCVIAEIQSDDPSNMTKEEYQQQLQQFTI